MIVAVRVLKMLEVTCVAWIGSAVSVAGHTVVDNTTVSVVTKVVFEAAGQWTTLDGQAVIVEVRVVMTVDVVRGAGVVVALGMLGPFVTAGGAPVTTGWLPLGRVSLSREGPEADGEPGWCGTPDGCTAWLLPVD